MIEDLPEVLSEWLDSSLDQIYTCLPGTIKSYDPDKKIAEVNIQVKIPLQGGEMIELPPIVNVPVVGINSASFSLTYELVEGDGVLLMFSTVALGNFLANTGSTIQEPESLRRFALTDAIAMPGLFPSGKLPDNSKAPAINVTKKTLEVTTPDGGSLLLDDGTFKISDSSGNVIESSSSSVKINGNLEVLQ